MKKMTPPPTDLICFSHLRWGFVFQRPNHLMIRFARRRRTYFVEEPRFEAGLAAPRMEVVREPGGPFVCVPWLPEGTPAAAIEEIQRRLVQDLVRARAIRPQVLWFYTPMALPVAAGLHAPLVVYDCMDELSAFLGAPPELVEREAELFEHADLVLTGGHSLYETKRARHPNVHAFPSSVDAEHFARARWPQPDPEDQVGLPRPRLGFFGVIDERMDLPLVAGLADARPDWQVVMVGPVVKIDPEALPRRANLHWLGGKGYAELPRYLAGWDVALMPFARNPSTEHISPTKTLEYLAAGKPVVSTAIRDVVHPYGVEGLARIADDVGGFASAVEAALLEDPAARWAASDAVVARTSWDSTWSRIDALMQQALRAAHPCAAAVPPTPARVSAPAAAPAVTGRAAYDFLVVGAGFAGSVLAERLARQLGKRVLVCDKRPHVGGNAYDCLDAAGVLIHKYGPHIFHTASQRIFSYLSKFTKWRAYEHRVLAHVDGKLLPFPINVDTVNGLYGLSLTPAELEEWFRARAEPMGHCLTSEDAVVSKIGRELYEKFFRNYTRKQWGLDPSQLDAAVAARVPARCNHDDRYFTDEYQFMPLHGYTRMFEAMLDHPRIDTVLGVGYAELAHDVRWREMVYTGPIDAFFDFRYGKLPYRSLRFEFVTYDHPRHQPGAVINYPNEHEYTRVTELKYLTGQVHPKTSLVYEYPQAEGEPYYPVPRPENAALYRRYKALADATPHVRFVGRLATYRYYNMDQVVGQALAMFDQIRGVRERAVPGAQVPGPQAV
jgi:UDP-galactopyranose mutase